MEDNVQINEGSEKTIAADAVTRNAVTELQQVIKISLGADGEFDTLVDSGQQTMANSVPVVLASDQTDISIDDGGNSITVDGTVTANLSATDNAVLDSIDSAVNGTLSVDLGANNDVTIDNSSIVHAEDSAHSSTDAGVMLLGVRNDNDTTLTSDDGDYSGVAVSKAGHAKTHLAHVQSKISTNNSSTSTLTGDATFTGTSEDTSNYASIKVSVFTDQNSATDGLQLQFSSDDSNWDISYDFDVTANQAFVAEVGPEARYFRVVYTNGSSAQSVFRLQTIFHPVTTEKLGAPVGSTIEDEDNAQLVRSVLAGANPGGTYSNIGITNGGSLKMSLEEAEGLAGQATMANSVPVVIASDQSDISIDDGGNSITVDGTVTANLGATDNAVLDSIDSAVNGTLSVDLGANNDVTTELASASALSDSFSNPTTAPVGAFLMQWDGGTDWERVRGNIGDGSVATGMLNIVPMVYNGSTYDRLRGSTSGLDINDISAGTQTNDINVTASGNDNSNWNFADINDSSSGDNTIVAAQGAGNKIAVWSVMVVSDGTADVRFEDGAAGTAFTGQIPLQAREGFTYSAGGVTPLWVGSANTLLNLELSAAVNVHGHVAYTVVS